MRRDDWIASGFYADSSAFSADAFYVQAFVMPRFVPADSLYFDYGFRVNGRWDTFGPELPAAVAGALPELVENATFAGLLANSPDWERNIHHTELRLGIGVLTRDENVFGLASKAARRIEPTVEWEARVRERCVEFADLVLADGFVAGETVLGGRRGGVDQHFEALR